jgi:electron transport complex protein RnfC
MVPVPETVETWKWKYPVVQIKVAEHGLMLATLFKFRGGVKPDAHKDESTRTPIAARAAAGSRLVVPLRQSAGGTPLALVGPGRRCSRASASARPRATSPPPCTPPPRAPCWRSSRACCRTLRACRRPAWSSSPTARSAGSNARRWTTRRSRPTRCATCCATAGIVGLGGATFPSHIKLQPGAAGRIGTLVINGAECEPWITCDDLLMRERAAGIVRGIAILRHIVSAERVLVGIEDNKPQAIAAMRAAAAQAPASRSCRCRRAIRPAARSS